MATATPPFQTRFKQVYLFTDQADDAVIRRLTNRNPNLQADDLMDVAAQVIAQHPTSKFCFLHDIEELPPTFRSTFPKYEITIYPRHQLDTKYPPLFHLVSRPELQPSFATPIWVICDDDDSNAGLATYEEIDGFNRENFLKTYRFGSKLLKTLNWNRLLLNPNAASQTFIDLPPIRVCENFDSSNLKYLGAHLNHLESEQIVDDNGFVIVQTLQRAAITMSPKPDHDPFVKINKAKLEKDETEDT